MSTPCTLNQGGTVTYSTSVAGHNTTLYAQASEEGLCQITWRAALCCQSDAVVDLQKGQSKAVNISKAGALVVVRNTGYYPVTVWTS